MKLSMRRVPSGVTSPSAPRNRFCPAAPCKLPLALEVKESLKVSPTLVESMDCACAVVEKSRDRSAVRLIRRFMFQAIEPLAVKSLYTPALEPPLSDLTWKPAWSDPLNGPYTLPFTPPDSELSTSSDALDRAEDRARESMKKSRWASSR